MSRHTTHACAGHAVHTELTLCLQLYRQTTGKYDAKNFDSLYPLK